jgi:hypothetical protein
MANNPLFDVNWSLESSRSKFSVAGWNPAHETRLYEEVRGGYKLTVKGTNQGTPYQWGYTALYDGKDHPVHGRPDIDSIEAYRVNDRITIGFFKKDGAEVAMYKRGLLSEKSLQVVASGLDEKGAAYFDVVEYKAP